MAKGQATKLVFFHAYLYPQQHFVGFKKLTFIHVFGGGILMMSKDHSRVSYLVLCGITNK
jgi:hypothetical protein